MSFESDTDTLIAKLHEELAIAQSRLSQAVISLHRSAGHVGSGKWVGHENYQWDGTLSEALASGRPDAIVAYVTAVKTVDEARESLRDANALYTGWSRFYLVTNVNGHIHRDMACSTCRHNTEYRWVTDLSGQTEAEAVAELGEILCSVCYPSAPVAWSTGVSKATQAARDERSATKAAAAIKKAEKALLPDGSPLRLTTRGYRESIYTLAAAKMFLTDCAEHRRFGYSILDEAAESVVAEAVAAKTGETVSEVLDAAAKRAAKR